MFRFLICFGFLIFCTALPAQSDSLQQVEILNTEQLEGTFQDGQHTKKLQGNVLLQQGKAKLSCDKATIFEPSNDVEARGDVHINHADSVHAYGKKLSFKAAERMAILRDTVQLRDLTMVITTDYLDYNLNSRIARYRGGGTVKNKDIELSSSNGYYHANTKDAFFRNEVVLQANNYTVKTDTLKYNIETGKTTFLAATNITNDRNSIFCRGGYFDNESGIAVFKKDAILKNQEQEIRADSIWYDQNNGLGKAYGNVQLFDKEQNLKTYGDVAFYNDMTGLMEMQENAWFVNVFDGDSLFLSADRLKSAQEENQEQGAKNLLAHGNVKIYKSDLQGVCDSLTYSDSDSSLWLFGDPILWGENAQFSADTIHVIMVKGEVEKIELYSNALIVSEVLPSVYDQISGRNMVGFMDSSKLDYLDVKGNGQSLYFAQDDEKRFVGVNRALCGQMRIHMYANKVNRIIFLQQPEASFKPIPEVDPKNLRLEQFKWEAKRRPLSSKSLIPD